MSILSSLKEERKLSLNHWRYRILHWAFSVKGIRHPQESGLPMYFYTHYCPLFHLTNLIALLSPLILLIKVIAVITGAFLGACSRIDLSGLQTLIGRIMLAILPSPSDSEARKPPLPPPCRRKETKLLLEILANGKAVGGVAMVSDLEAFAQFWEYYGRLFNALSESEVRAICQDVLPKIEAARERRRLRKEAFRQRLIFWTNFSQAFIKWFLYAAYAFLAVTLVYLVYLAVGPVFYGVCWFLGFVGGLFTDASFTGALWFLAKFLFYAMAIGGGAFGTLYVAIKSRFLQSFGQLCFRGLATMAPPFYVVGTFFGWVGTCWTATLEFIEMFYEENCPPVTIISEEEEIIESAQEKEVA